MTPNDWHESLGIESAIIEAADLVQLLRMLGAAKPARGGGAKAPLLLEETVGDRRLQLAGHGVYGLPTARDREVFVALLQHSRPRGVAGKIPFSPHQLLQDLGWERHPIPEERLLQSLICWRSITCTVTQTVRNSKGKKATIESAAHLMDSYRLCHPATPEAAASATPPAGWFSWSQDLEALMLTNMSVVLAVVGEWVAPPGRSD